jgi:type I restriction enzyme, R subunit
MDAFEAHTTMSKQAIDSEKVREGLKDVFLGPAQLYEALRAKTSQKIDGAESQEVGTFCMLFCMLQSAL